MSKAVLRTLLAFLLLTTAVIAQTDTPTIDPVPPVVNTPLVPSEFGLIPDTGQDMTVPFQNLAAQASAKKQPIVLAPGTYCMNPTLKNLKGLQLSGHSMESTCIQEFTPGTPAITVHGLWFSTIKNITFRCGSASKTAPVEFDGGAPLGTMALQGNRFEKCVFDARGINDGKHSQYAVCFARQGQGSAQCDMTVFEGCYFYGGSEACIAVVGYNALNNSFQSCNFQGYQKHAIMQVHGSAQIYNCAFQPNHQALQYLNGGYDINIIGGGVEETIGVLFCRTEGVRFLRSQAGSIPYIVGTCHNCAVPAWSPGTSYSKPVGTLDAGKRYGVIRYEDGKKLYIAKATHISGDEFDPKLWDLQTFNVVDTYAAHVDKCNQFDVGDVLVRQETNDPIDQVSKDYTVAATDETILVDAKTPVTVTLPDARFVTRGKEYRIVKGDASNNKVRINTLYLQASGSASSYVLRNQGDTICLKAMGGGTLPVSYHVVGFYENK
jgi:hypothetical protein